MPSNDSPIKEEPKRPVSEQAKRSHTRKRIKWVVGIAGTVLLMAGIMFGVWALTAPSEQTRSTVSAVDAEEESRLLYEQALAALESDDASAAVELLEKAVAMDPLNTSARARLESLKNGGGTSSDSGGSSSGDGNTPGDTPDDPDEGFTDSVSDLVLLLPAEVEGYEMGAPLATDKDAQITAEASRRSGPGDRVRTSTFYAHDLGDTDSAKSFVTNQMHTAFPKNSAEVTVNGVDAYFGTDGERLAVVSFSRGRYAMEVIVAAQPGTSPGSLLDLAVEAAEAFPTSL